MGEFEKVECECFVDALYHAGAKSYSSLLAVIASFGRYKPHNACKILEVYKHSTDLVCLLKIETSNVRLLRTYKAILKLNQLSGH